MSEMISYALLHEDVVLNRVFGGRTHGFYIDIGANHPTIGSITKHFYDLGWRGVNVEPNPILLELLRKERPQDENVGSGLSDSPGRLTFYRVVEDDGLSTFSAPVADQHRDRHLTIIPEQIETETLATITVRYAASKTVDFLK